MTSRRRFLQLGLGATLALAVVRVLEGALAPAAAPHRVLDPAGARIVRALAPVVLAGALPQQAGASAAAIGRAVDGFDRTLAGLDPADREAMSRLLGLLRFAPTRLVLAGLWRPVDEAPAADIAGFLARWRSSPFDMLRTAYLGITQLLQGAWYDDPEAWTRIGYPGPPELAPGSDA